MNYRLIVTTVAEQNVLDACLYYEAQQHGLADRFLTELLVAYEKIITHPLYYSFISSEYKFRDIKLHHFPFVVIYEINDEEVIVLSVFNTNREPIY